MANSITPPQFEPAFDIVTAMREGRLNRSKAIELMAKTGFGLASAAFYLNALLIMPTGEVYKKPSVIAQLAIICSDLWMR
ncbi:hypothetical protein GNT65_14910 [Shewanella sp. JBTF-M18]|uniref:Uncharacterized protein n=1 Tax=Shewanella insulae TaxID=2681496 RepID=A0A6L7I3Q2_9GAMM|nr:hypothetical protein [Shewanella insulae]MXR69951.1 hypothetical protein [Shewanella insulae]